MSVQINPNLEEAVSEIPPDIKKCLEETAYTAAKIGDARALEFERRIYAADVKNAVFHFLHPSDPYHACYKKKVAEYRSQPQPPVRSTCDPELPPVYSYSKVVRRCRKPDTSKEDLVDGFLGLLQAEGVGTALIDLRVLEYLANTEDKELLHPSMMMNPPQQMQRPVAVPPPDCIRFVEHTARFVSSHDNVLECQRRMLAADVNNESFSFLVSSDRYHAYYQKKLTEYRARFQPPVKEPLFDGPYNLTLLPEGIASKELDYMKLTAMCSQKPDTSSADLVDDFLGLFQADEQQDEGAVMAMIDLPTFECVMDMQDNVLLLKHALNPPQ
ncbi:unnamed protein product [Arabidopsis halleri]